MIFEQRIEVGQILIGPQFSEPMRVVSFRKIDVSKWELELVGNNSHQYRRIALSEHDLSGIQILASKPSYGGNGELMRLGLQARSLGIAYEFDPYFGLSISRVDPLPHQLEAVYDYMLKLPRVRFLLADDAGAGKTIMAGLLIRELELRGLAERILIVCPANLTFQWQRELKEKFDEQFIILKGANIRDQFGSNQWLEHKHVLTSLDLAKRLEILPGLRQVQWDLVIVDEAHRMSAADESHKSYRYKLGELLRDSSDHFLLLTATPHKGDPLNFTLFLQLLDADAFADIKSIRQAMENERAPFYLRRVKEVMVYFPERKEDGSWVTKQIFTKRIPRTVDFQLDGDEFELYRLVTEFVKHQSAMAAAQTDNKSARAIGFLMSLYQRRLASSTYALRRSLEKRAKRLDEKLKLAKEVAKAVPDIPDETEFEEMEEWERERILEQIEAVSLAERPEEVQSEITSLIELAKKAEKVEEAGSEAKLSKLKDLLSKEGFFNEPDKRLLIFTEFKDTLDYLVQKLRGWGFRVGFIHGGMKPGNRDEPGTRIFTEQQFRDGEIQVLVATEAAGEGINLQVCNILFNYDIPWNPNRLEQRMGRIHRYGQRKDCLIFNFVATNTVEGRILQRLLERLQNIRDALEDDAVFNVVGEILAPAHIERVLRDYYACKLDEDVLEETILADAEEGKFRDICQNALEGLATKELNLSMLLERRARAQERRVVPETIARFIRDADSHIGLKLKSLGGLPHTFYEVRIPTVLKRYERETDWRLPEIASKYPNWSTDRETAERRNLEWVTPGHPLFEAVRRHICHLAISPLASGACFYSLKHETPARIDFYRAQAVDGRNRVIREGIFAVELADGTEPLTREISVIGDFTPANPPEELPSVAFADEVTSWLYANLLQPFYEEVVAERSDELARVASHVELSLTELLHKADQDIGKAQIDVEKGIQGAEGRLAQAETRHSELTARRARRLKELEHERAITLQSVERITSVLVLPHPELSDPEVRHMTPNPETEAIAMRIVMEHEENRGCKVFDVSAKNLGYDITSMDKASGDLRLIEVKGFAGDTGTIVITPNERRVAEDRRDCYWLYVVANCTTEPHLLSPVLDPARMPWFAVQKIQHYSLPLKSMASPDVEWSDSDGGGGK